MIQVSVSEEREGGGGEQSTELWLDWLTLGKGQLEGMRGEELPKWLFSLLFLPLARAETLYGYLWACGRARGAAAKPTSPLCCEGWAGLRCLSLARFCHIYMHMHAHASAHTLLRTPPRAARTEEKTLLRGRFGKWGVLHTIAVSSLIDASQASKPHETSTNWRPLTSNWTTAGRCVSIMSILWHKSRFHLGFWCFCCVIWLFNFKWLY